MTAARDMCIIQVTDGYHVLSFIVNFEIRQKVRYVIHLLSIISPHNTTYNILTICYHDKVILKKVMKLESKEKLKLKTLNIMGFTTSVKTTNTYDILNIKYKRKTINLIFCI